MKEEDEKEEVAGSDMVRQDSRAESPFDVSGV